MRFLKIIGIASPLILAGCLAPKDDNTDASYVQPSNYQLQQRQRQQDALNRQARQASQQIEETQRKKKAAEDEAKQIQQAKEDSLRTCKEEEARLKQKAAEEEARQLQQAKENSLRTFKEEEGRRQKSTGTSPTAAPPVAAPQPTEWRPLDGHIVRAGELVVELKRNKGGVNPSHEEMSAYLQSKMALTPSQAEKVLDELGL